QIDFDDPLDAAGTQYDRYARVDVALTVFAVEVRDSGQDAPLVLQNRLGHLDDGKARGVVGAARLQQVDDFAAAAAGPLDDGPDAYFGDQMFNGDAPYVRITDEGHHVVAVDAHDERGDVLHGNTEFLGDKRAKTRRIQHSGLPDHALRRQSAHPVGDVGHHIDRNRDDDESSPGRALRGFAHDGSDDAIVRLQWVVSGHARLAGLSRRYDDHVGVGRIVKVVGADYVAVKA